MVALSLNQPLLNSASFILAFYLLNSSPILHANQDVKDKCDICKDIVKHFHEGIKNTEKSNFGGGNTHWEEKSLGSYVFSETRLIEITEKLCTDSKSKCHSMVEEFEEVIENWWFQHYAKNKKTVLMRYLCINNMKVCCKNGTWGSDCKECTGGVSLPCKGNGDCDGEGTRGGSGKCSCKSGYQGDVCDTCTDGYYEESKNETTTVCQECHVSCKDICHEGGPKGCDECKAGWQNNEEEGCQDINECDADTPPCTESQYCTNTEGSYTCTECAAGCAGCTAGGDTDCKACKDAYLKEDDTCKACHASCKSACTDLTPKGCAECKEGYSWTEENGCRDIDECAAGESPCDTDQFCVNSEGSHDCMSCDASCKTCKGSGAANCIDCMEGYEKQNDSCVDVDECLSATHCSGQNERCVNSAGSFSCECVANHVRKDGQCQPKSPGKKRKTKKKNNERIDKKVEGTKSEAVTDGATSNSEAPSPSNSPTADIPSKSDHIEL